jgi:hypothetical protein
MSFYNSIYRMYHSIRNHWRRLVKLTVNVEVQSGGKSGTEARAPSLHLTSYGPDETEALELLKRGIAAWCQGLQSVGKLDKALRERKLRWDPNGTSLDVEFVVSEAMPDKIGGG